MDPEQCLHRSWSVILSSDSYRLLPIACRASGSPQRLGPRRVLAHKLPLAGEVKGFPLPRIVPKGNGPAARAMARGPAAGVLGKQVRRL